MKCPEPYHPGCCCRITADEPHQDCYIHGGPDVRRCPFCGQFRGFKPCKRCGCSFGLEHIPKDVEQEAQPS